VGEPPSAGRESAFFADLRAVLAERDFRKLFTSRLVSQAGDGIFNAGFTAYVFFGAATFPNPVAAVDAFAVLYLPYSLIGPFAGVFIDRWSRRQIIVWSALIRAVIVVVTSVIVASGQTRWPLFIAVLAALGMNRFFLSAVSAGTPHVVAPDKLVMANAVAPTCGTIASFAGGMIGLGIPIILGGGHVGSSVTLLLGGACYVAAGLAGMRIGRDLLGPAARTSAQADASLARELGNVARGLADGLRHLGERRKAAYALGAVGVHRTLYGTLLLMALLLYRNYFYAGASGSHALGHAAPLVATSAVGFGLAAVVTPIGTRRTGKDGWITSWLAIAALVTLLLGATFNQYLFLALGLIMGLSAQSVKICVDTTVQQQVDDAYMGRVFSVYDMLFNVAYVVGPAIAVPFMPVTGKSYTLVIAIAAGYLAAALVYATLTLRTAAGPRPGGSPPPRPTAIARR
jgi:MFS family permease